MVAIIVGVVMVVTGVVIVVAMDATAVNMIESIDSN